MGSSPAKRATPSIPYRIRDSRRPIPRGRLAQPVRALALHARGQRFESSIAHHPTFQTYSLFPCDYKTPLDNEKSRDCPMC